MVSVCVSVLSLIALLSCDSNQSKINRKPVANLNQDKPPEPLGVKGLVPNFSSIYEYILLGKCVSCHSGESPAAHINLSSYESVRDAHTFPLLIRPLDAQASLLYQVVRSGSMPPGALKLSNYELEALETWINAGARKNETDPVPLPAPLPTEPPD